MVIVDSEGPQEEGEGLPEVVWEAEVVIGIVSINVVFLVLCLVMS